jgi:hypothetical protein
VASASGDASIRPFHVEIPQENLTRDDVITMTWVTNTRISSGRLYSENTPGFHVKGVTVPPLSASSQEGSTRRRGAGPSRPTNLIYFNELDRGNHFAAWQEPDLFTTEIRAAFTSLR